MAQNLYDTLWVSKTATQDEIKKANTAYQTLSDESKRKQYDTFGTASWAWGNPFSGGGNPFWGWGSSGGFSGFEDIFWGMWGSSRGQNVEFDFWDLFWGAMWWQGRSRGSSAYDTRREPPKPQNLDFEKTYEIPVFDMILGCKIEVSWVYGQKAKLTIPAGTKSGAKFRVKEYGKSEWSKKWNLIIKAVAKMPKSISDTDRNLLEQIRDNIGY